MTSDHALTTIRHIRDAVAAAAENAKKAGDMESHARSVARGEGLEMALKAIDQAKAEPFVTASKSLVLAIEEYGAACQAFGAHVERACPPAQDPTGVHRSILEETHRPMMDAYSRVMDEMKRFATGRQEK